jgi:hypothetical protein
MKHSYSSINCFKNCPRQYEAKYVSYSYVDKGNDQNRWGTKVHTHLENNIKHDAPLPPELVTLAPLMQIVKAAPGIIKVEESLAVNMQLQPVSYMAKDAYIRGKLDLTKRNGPNGFVADYKTGKLRDDFYQLELSSLLLMATYPEVNSVLTMFLWSKVGKFTQEKYTRLQAQNMWNKVVTDCIRIEQAVAKKDFPPKRSGLCGWCHLTSCEHCIK